MKTLTRIGNLLPLIFRAVAMAMGVAVVVLSGLGVQKDPASLIWMLGLGLALLGIASLDEARSHER